MLGAALLAAAAPAAAAAADAPCSAACASLLHLNSVTCATSTYDYSWGNDICEGILPACVVRPANASEVAAVVKAARAQNASLSYRSGGHSYTCNSIKEHSIHLDLRSLDAVRQQPSKHYNGTELVFGSGNIMRGLIDALQPGQTIVHGQCPTVGAGGLFLHGGYHTTLTLDYGRGNDTVTWMEVVSADGDILQLSDESPPEQQDLWAAMRQAGSSFAIATTIAAKVFDVGVGTTTDGGDFFAVDLPRSQLLDMMDESASERPGLPNYINVNGADFLIASASKSFKDNAAWVEEHVLKRKLTSSEYLRSDAIHALEQIVSQEIGGSDKQFGKSGAVPYIFSSQEAFATVSFIMPIECYRKPAMKALLAAVPDHRDNTTDLGCYFQVTTTYGKDHAFVDYNCAYDSTYYRRKQKELNAAVKAICPRGLRHYVNTPSSFLTPRDYYPNYDDLAAIKTKWDASELFRVYQGVRPTGLPPDAYEFERPGYKRRRDMRDLLGEVGWDLLKKLHWL